MKICIDHREDEKVQRLIKSLAEEYKFEVEVKQLPVGDYICEGKKLVIERKSITDFYSSVVSQHIFDQVKNMMENYDERYIIISGSFKQLLTDPNNFHVSVHVYLGAIASLASKYNTTVITVESEKQLAYLVYKLCEKSGESVDLKPVLRLAFSAEDAKVSALTAVRGISVEKAKRIMEKFPSIGALCLATDEELCRIDGIAKKTASNIKEVFYN